MDAAYLAVRLWKLQLSGEFDPQVAETLPEPLRRRVRHVVKENNRVLE